MSKVDMPALVPELYCTNIERTIDFYTKDLGFSIRFQRLEDKFAYFEREGCYIMVEQVDIGRKWITGELTPPFGRGMSFQIKVSDAQKLHDGLKAAGYTFFLPLEEKWYRQDDMAAGNLQFIIQDPDGFLLRFAQDLGKKPFSEVAK